MAYATEADGKPVTLRALDRAKAAGEAIVVLTAYDASFAAACDAAGIDVVLVGDSLGMVVQGQSSTLPVSVDAMAYHTAAVARGLKRALLIADMPFGSYPDPATAFRNAAQLMAAGAAMVKLEGAGVMLESIRYLADRDIPVCAHLGLTPQSVHALSGYRVQGREADAAAKLRADAAAVVAAGARLLVLECVPATLATEITAAIPVPTIGIGAGVGCSGQVLVCYDMLGVTPGKRPKFSMDFLVGRGSVVDAFAAYAAAVRERRFPGPEHSF